MAVTKKLEKLDAIIFIDTNILLDFYRIRKSDISIKYLEEIEKHKELIITTSQVEMEFKKNRQAVILESIGEVKKKTTNNISIPPILSNAQAVGVMDAAQKKINEQQKKLKLKIEKILKDPKKHDPVYKSLQKLFKNKSTLNLNRENKIRFTIRNLAKKRFLLGYPPRKKSDNSIGDAVNWEWIVKCAEESGKHIILVSRDTDFGIHYDHGSYLNDWLDQEFKQRISRKRKLILTDKLSVAFKLVEIPITEEMEREEEKIIKYNFDSARIRKALDELQQTLQENSNNFNRMWSKQIINSSDLENLFDDDRTENSEE